MVYGIWVHSLCPLGNQTWLVGKSLNSMGRLKGKSLNTQLIEQWPKPLLIDDYRHSAQLIGIYYCQILGVPISNNQHKEMTKILNGVIGYKPPKDRIWKSGIQIDWQKPSALDNGKGERILYIHDIPIPAFLLNNSMTSPSCFAKTSRKRKSIRARPSNWPVPWSVLREQLGGYLAMGNPWRKWSSTWENHL